MNREGAERFEALLDDHERRLAERRPSVSVVSVSDRVVSIGVGAALSAAVERALRAERIPLVRRRSGGLAVLHSPGDLVWSIVAPLADRRVGSDYVRAYDRLGGAVVEALEATGRSGARWTAAPAVSSGYCLLGPRGLVVQWNGRVVGGAAQHRRGEMLLHHGILVRHVDRPLLTRLFFAGDPSLPDRLGGIDDTDGGLAPFPATALEDALARAWSPSRP